MLDLFRRNANNILGMGLVVVIAVVFVFNFGRQQSGWGQGASTIVACSVYGDDIQEISFRWLFIMNGGKSIPIEDQKKMKLRETTLEGLIERDLLARQAMKLGFFIREDEIDDQILKGNILVSKSIDSVLEESKNYRLYYRNFNPGMFLIGSFSKHMDFSKDGVFQYNDFRSFVLHHLESNLKAFKNDQNKELLAFHLRQAVISNVRVDDKEAYDNFMVKNLMIKLNFVRFVPLFYQENMEVTLEVLKSWIEDNRDKINQYYSANAYQYVNLSKQARASQILFKYSEPATEAEKLMKLSDATKAIAAIRRGEDFSNLAEKISEDISSARRGGDLGWVQKGRLPSSLEDALFKLTPGQISGPIETNIGVHIVKLERYREGTVSLVEATPEIAEKLFREEKGSELALLTAQESLRQMQGGTAIGTIFPTIEPNDDPLIPQVRTTQFFSRHGNFVPEIGADARLAEAVFSLTPSAPFLKEPFRVGNDFYVVSLLERNDPTPESFEQGKTAIISDLADQKRLDILASYTKALVTKAMEDDAIWRNLNILVYPSTSSRPDNESDKAPSSSNSKPVKERTPLSKTDSNIPVPEDDKTSPESPGKETAGAAKDNIE